MRYRITWTIAAAAIAAVGYFAVNLPALYARVKLDRSFPALSRYVFEPTPEIVLVGSSMAYRLYEGYFSTSVRNLAIGGGSPLTGLAIIASYEQLPRTILVETNIMSRPIDVALVSAFGQSGDEPFRWFRPARAVISRIYYWINYQSEAESMAKLLRGPPIDYDISKSVSDAGGEYASDHLDAKMVENVKTMKHLVEELERRGCRVTFFEMPFPPPLGESHFAVTARTLTKAAFPSGHWIDVAADEQELRWLDASHLDERSAAIVARKMTKDPDSRRARPLDRPAVD
jgi:hypothetical protein